VRQTVLATRFSQIQGPDAPTPFEKCGLARRLAAEPVLRQAVEIGAPALLVVDAELIEIGPGIDPGIVQIVEGDAHRKKGAAEALAYNGLVHSWPEIARLAREAGSAQPAQADLLA